MRTPQIGDRTLSAEWLHAVDRAMRQKINPDPLSHFVREGAGNMRFAASTSADEPYHFLVETDTATTVKVHAGYWTRCAGNVETTVDMGIDDDDTSRDADDFLTVTVSGSGWIILTIDDALTPTTLTASWTSSATTAFPTGPSKCTVRALAYVTVTSSVVSAVDMLYYGGDIKDFILVPDATMPTPTQRSLDYAVDKTGEIDGWTAGTLTSRATVPPYDKILVRSLASGIPATTYSQLLQITALINVRWDSGLNAIMGTPVTFWAIDPTVGAEYVLVQAADCTVTTEREGDINDNQQVYVVPPIIP